MRVRPDVDVPPQVVEGAGVLPPVAGHAGGVEPAEGDVEGIEGAQQVGDDGAVVLIRVLEEGDVGHDPVHERVDFPGLAHGIAPRLVHAVDVGHVGEPARAEVGGVVLEVGAQPSLAGLGAVGERVDVGGERDPEVVGAVVEHVVDEPPRALRVEDVAVVGGEAVVGVAVSAPVPAPQAVGQVGRRGQPVAEAEIGEGQHARHALVVAEADSPATCRAGRSTPRAPPS